MPTPWAGLHPPRPALLLEPRAGDLSVVLQRPAWQRRRVPGRPARHGAVRRRKENERQHHVQLNSLLVSRPESGGLTFLSPRNASGQEEASAPLWPWPDA